MAEAPIVVNVKGVGQVNFPSHYTPEQIKFSIENDILPRTKGMVEPPKVDVIDNTVAKPEKPDLVTRFARGVVDFTEGVQQKTLQAQEAAGTVPQGTAQAFTRDKTYELGLYERNRTQPTGRITPLVGTDIPRLAGNAAATAWTSLLPGGQAASLPVRMLSGAAQSGLSGGLLFTPEGGSQLEQTLISAGIGAAFPAVAQGLRMGVQSLKQKFANPQTIDLPALQGELTLQLQREGIDFAKLTNDVQKSLLADAQKALQMGGNLDDAALARKAAIETVGAKPTRASVTRAPRDWQAEQNLRGIQGVGDPLVQRAQENAQALTDYLSRLRQQSGGKAGTPYEAGESAIKAIRASDEAKKTAIDNLYTIFRDMGANDVAVPATKLASALGQVADLNGVENIPAAVLNRLKEYGLLDGKQTKLLTINEADKLNRLINNNNPGKNTPGARALAPIKEALDEALMDVPEAALPASEALKTARATAAKRFAENRASKGLQAAVDDVAPDRFVNRFILNADVRDVRGMLAELRKTPQGAQAIKDIKGHVFDTLLMKATGATNLDDIPAQFSGAAFGKALDAIPFEKLTQIFTPVELQSLKTLQKAANYLTKEVPFSDVNNSKTTAALANLLLKIGNTPMVGKMLSPIIGAGKIGADWINNANDRRKVAEVLLGSAASPGAKPPAPSAGKFDRLVPPVAGAVAYEANQ